MIASRNSYRVNFLCLGVIVILGVILGLPIQIYGQTKPNSGEINQISFKIPFVTKDGQKVATTRVSETKYEFNGGSLTLDDGIRFAWVGVDIDLKYKDLPAQFGGWLKIYVDDYSKEENFILDYGTYPADSVGLKLSDLAFKLKDGRNTIWFVFIGYENLKPTPKARVQFSFDFQKISRNPIIEITKPQPKSVIARNVSQDFEIWLTNFVLEKTPNNLPNRGKLNLYYNEITANTLLITIDTALEQAGKQRVVFNTKDIEKFREIPDSYNTKIIAVLTNTNGELLSFRTSLEVITNFQNTLDIGFPRVTIVEPRKDRSNLEVTGEQKFILKIDNFEIFSKDLTPRTNESGKGYLQIFLNSKPVEIAFPKTEFTLNEIGASRFGSGTINVKVQLVNFDFTKLNPEAVDSIDVIFNPATLTVGEARAPVQNDIWRYVIVGVIVAIVLVSIVILVVKG